jgi:hypothetical protein
MRYDFQLFFVQADLFVHDLVRVMPTLIWYWLVCFFNRCLDILLKKDGNYFLPIRHKYSFSFILIILFPLYHESLNSIALIIT